MKIRAIIFDLDGTLIDSLADLANAVNRALVANGFPERDRVLFPEFIGDGMRVLIERALPANARTPETIDQCTTVYAEEYAACWHDETVPYSGIDALLEQLAKKDLKLGVISNKPDAFTRLCCDHFFPAGVFSIVFGQREGVERKPAPDAAIEACAVLQVSPSECAYLGDSGVDMRFAKAAGMIPIGVTWGFRSRDELLGNGATHLLDQPADLLAILEEKNS